MVKKIDGHECAQDEMKEKGWRERQKMFKNVHLKDTIASPAHTLFYRKCMCRRRMSAAKPRGLRRVSMEKGKPQKIRTWQVPG